MPQMWPEVLPWRWHLLQHGMQHAHVIGDAEKTFTLRDLGQEK